jgi:hypothetical protein
MNREVFDIVLPVFIGIAMILWIYCLWFANKYDKKANSLIFLFFLNIYYVPFYLYRINKIKKLNKLVNTSEDIIDSEFIEQTRIGIIDIIGLWASRELQLDYQESDKERNLSEDLFIQWIDLYRIDFKVINESFSDTEKEFLKKFDKTLEVSLKKLNNEFPMLIDFKKTNDWKVLNNMANQIVENIKK